MIRPLAAADVEGWAELRSQLWPACTPEDSLEDWEEMQEGLDSCGQPCAVYVACEGERLTGFVEVTLRAYADGCETSPVGYLEGWFVLPDCRRDGIGKALVEAAEQWARDKGCQEMASDTELSNDGSRKAHEKVGFEVVETIVQFRKEL